MPKYVDDSGTVIEAAQFHGENWDELYNIAGPDNAKYVMQFHKAFVYRGDEGDKSGEIGDWIVKLPAGQIRTWSNALFRMTFKAAE